MSSHLSRKNLVAITSFFDGASGQVESWFEKVTGFTIACFVIDSDSFREVDVELENKKRVCKTTDFPEKGTFKGYPLVVSSNWVDKILEMGVNKVLCLEPDNQRRREQITSAKSKGLQLVSAIHPTVTILNKAQIEDGVWINAGSIIGYKAEIKAGAIVNTGVQIDHHNVLEECCQIDPGVVTAGNVVLRECCHIHTGATLINRVEVGVHSIVGAGSVVLKNVPAYSTVVGVPAKIIKSWCRQ